MDLNEYGKFLYLTTGEEFIIQETPVVCGTLSKIDIKSQNLRYNVNLEEFIGKTLQTSVQNMLRFLKINLSEANFLLDKIKKVNQNINNISDNVNDEEYLTDIIPYIKSKLILTTCSKLFPYHFIIYRNKKGEFCLYPIGICYVNGTQFQNKSKTILDLLFLSKHSIKLHQNDVISFNCELCKIDHIFLFYCQKYKGTPKSMIQKQDKNDNNTTNTTNKTNTNTNTTTNTNPIKSNNQNNSTSPNPCSPSVSPPSTNMISTINPQKNVCVYIPTYPPDNELPHKWTMTQKDALKKGLLNYGYGRWDEIKKNSENLLNDAKEDEMIIFSNSFLRCLIRTLYTENESVTLVEFLSGLIKNSEASGLQWITPNESDWGKPCDNLAHSRAKRLYILRRVKEIIEDFKNREKNKKKKNNDNNNNDTTRDKKESNEEDTSLNWDTLLDNLPDSVFKGQNPTSWWSKYNDIDIIRGTYKYGYTKYNSMKNDSEYRIYQDLRDNKDEPKPEAITRRLKKIISCIDKEEKSKK